MIKVLFISGMFLVLSLGIIVVGIDAHERAHQQIFKAAGCTDATYSLDLLSMSGEARCHEYGRNTEVTKEEELHAWNEIVGYNMDALCGSLLAGQFMIALAILLKKE